MTQERSAPADADVPGFGDGPLARSPIGATVISSDAISAIGAKRLSDPCWLDASVDDAYNAVGCCDFASIRGFVLDSTRSLRCKALPISTEPSLSLDCLDRVSLLKGTSGIQAGTDAPDGLFNAVVKRPAQQPLRALELKLNDTDSAFAHLDLSVRLGEGGALGFRLNLAGERPSSAAPGTEDQCGPVDLTFDAKILYDSLLEGEFGWSPQPADHVWPEPAGQQTAHSRPTVEHQHPAREPAGRVSDASAAACATCKRSTALGTGRHNRARGSW